MAEVLGCGSFLTVTMEIQLYSIPRERETDITFSQRTKKRPVLVEGKKLTVLGGALPPQEAGGGNRSAGKQRDIFFAELESRILMEGFA